jgi:hypothetical protein
MRVVACGARVTVVEDPLTDGTLNLVPASAKNATGKETLKELEFVKYRAEYQPPPKANWGRIYWQPPIAN